MIDMLSPEAPVIGEVEAAAPDDPLAGKSQILHHPQDRAEIDALLQEPREPDHRSDDL